MQNDEQNAGLSLFIILPSSFIILLQ